MKKAVGVLVSIAFIFSAVTIFFLFSDTGITGHTLFGTVSLYINTGGPTIFIHSPLNTTYNFAIGSNYTLSLNVSTPNSNVGTWWFTLEDLFHSTIVNNSNIFSPNISFNAVRRSNRLTVYANDTFGEIGSKSVIFYISVPNSAPLLGNISTPLYACEGSSFSKRFNATDVDEETLSMSVSPTSPFFVFPSSFSGSTFVESDLFSGILLKTDVGDHSRTVSVDDGQYSDTRNITIKVIEINNAPVIDNIGVQTVYTHGANTNFYKQVIVNDIESGNSNSGNISFNISFQGEAIFNISQLGVMNFTANESYIGVYNITVCATDNALENISSNISLCVVTGLNITSCNNFSLTVTNQNRAPTIISYYPGQTTFNDTADHEFIFNITTYDPDYTIPDVYWYLNGEFIQYNSGNTTTQIGYNFGCGVDGMKVFRAEITDGLLNDSVSWNISLTGIACPTAISSVGGAGGGGAPYCITQWGCNDWQICQNTEVSLELGLVNGEDYREISASCAALGRDNSTCGYQTRTCFDNAYCNLTRQMPPLIQSCFYTSSPSCFDGLKNCHDGTCELLIDCGGPCTICSSCSDNIQNQGELGIDCGGPCPFQCRSSESPLLRISIWRTVFLWIFWLLLLILLIILVWRIIKLIRVHQEMQKEKKIQSALSK